MYQVVHAEPRNVVICTYVVLLQYTQNWEPVNICEEDLYNTRFGMRGIRNGPLMERWVQLRAPVLSYDYCSESFHFMS